MAALKDLMKVMEHQTAVEKRAADGILSCLEQGGTYYPQYLVTACEK